MKKKSSIKSQLTLVFITFSVVLTASFYLYFSNSQEETFERQFDQKNMSVLETAQVGLEIGLQNENFEAIKTIFDWLKTREDFEWIGITDSTKDFFAQYPEKNYDLKTLESFNNINRPLKAYHASWKTSMEHGEIYITFNTKDYHRRKEKLVTHVLYTGLGVIVLVSIISFFLSFIVSKPLINLQRTINRIAKGALAERVEIAGSKEIVDLSHAFNLMMNDIQRERETSERLLLNVLPAPIAERLKNGESNISDQYHDVSILFADLVGFTELSSRMDAHNLVKLLNEIFTEFDLLAEKYGVEKIKTIGDCYMAVAGLPTPLKEGTANLALMAQDMLAILHKIDEEHHLALNLRIGINTGGVVAGVIGKSKFIYDLWGDAVNLASRLESHGTPGKIHVSRSTYEHLKNDFEFEDRGEVHIKGKGELHTYFIKPTNA